MAHQVAWNKCIYEEFCKQAMLTDDEKFVIKTRIEGWSREKQAQALSVSVNTIDKMISTLKKKYDNAQKYSDILPKRKI